MSKPPGCVGRPATIRFFQRTSRIHPDLPKDVGPEMQWPDSWHCMIRALNGVLVWLVPVLFGIDALFFYAEAHEALGDAEFSGGFGFVAFGSFEGFDEHFAFDVGEGFF